MLDDWLDGFTGTPAQAYDAISAGMRRQSRPVALPSHNAHAEKGMMGVISYVKANTP